MITVGIVDCYICDDENDNILTDYIEKSEEEKKTILYLSPVPYFVDFTSFLYELNVVAVENGIHKIILGIPIHDRWNYSQFIKSLCAVGPSKRVNNLIRKSKYSKEIQKVLGLI